MRRYPKSAPFSARVKRLEFLLLCLNNEIAEAEYVQTYITAHAAETCQSPIELRKRARFAGWDRITS